MTFNPLRVSGIAFCEFASGEPDRLATLFRDLGFSRVMCHAERPIDLYAQGDIVFLLNRDPAARAGRFARAHGPSIPSLGWWVEDSADAARLAQERGAELASDGDYRDTRLEGSGAVPAVRGIGGSALYLVERGQGAAAWHALGFVDLELPEQVPDRGFFAIDHLTNNVEKGTMEKWASFYKDVFGFTEVRTFDIRGQKTGLTSYALRSPCGTFCIPINEADEQKSQINEYIEAYHGPGVQHLAFSTRDILDSVRDLRGTQVSFLDIESGYYEEVFERVPNVREDHDAIRDLSVLVDGDESGYLLQIFTSNVIGPIFFELIQRENHMSFGEGNFGALFRSIERDQARRGVFDDA